MLFLSANYGLMAPGGDLADRFGPGFVAGGQVEWMTWPGNWILALDGQFGFGGEVKEDVLAFLKDEDGFIVGRDLAISQVFLQQRFFTAGALFGKLIPLNPNNRRSGIRTTLGLHWTQHWIRVNDELNSLPQIEDDYGYGYDRRVSGFRVTESIGYQHNSLNRRVNLYGVFEFGQGFTQSIRTIDYSTLERDDRRRVDLTFVLRVGWCIPLYTSAEAGEIYY